MADNDIALMAHLMRRAGFGAQYDEIVERAARGYEATVEDLLNPTDDSPTAWTWTWPSAVSWNGTISSAPFPNTSCGG